MRGMRSVLEPLESRRLLAAAPQLVADLLPPEVGYNSFQISQLRAFDGEIYFVADDLEHGFELWKSDGTAEGTDLVKDIDTIGDGSYPTNLTVSNGTLFFTADDHIQGRTLWKTDGTEAGTVMVKDFHPITTGGAIASLLDLNGILYFTADDGVNASELWRSDGTPEGTWMVKDINPIGSSQILSMVIWQGELYFAARDGVSGSELWRSDGTAQGTYRVKDIRPGPDSGCFQVASAGDGLFLAANEGTNGVELWKSDGTEAGTALVKNIHASGNSNPASMLDVGGTLFFAATHAVDGTELWKSDGTEDGTVQVKNIRFGGSSNPIVVADYDGIAILTAHDGVNGREVWRSDGSNAGTFRISDLSSADNPFLGQFTYQDGLLYFSADSGASNYGTELFVTNGTLAGTELVADLWPGSGNSSPSGLTVLDGVIYFAAGGEVPHFQLWKLPDQIAPRVVSSALDVQTGHRITITFTEDVGDSLSAPSLQVQSAPVGPVVLPDSVSFDPATRTATFSFASPLEDGNYRATFPIGAAADPTGHTLAAFHTFDFFVLAGDANRDRKVDAVDLGIISTNWQGSGKTFSQGDFNYDGKVDIADLQIVASRWMTTLAPPAPAVPGPIAVETTVSEPAPVAGRPVAQPVPTAPAVLPARRPVPATPARPVRRGVALVDQPVPTITVDLQRRGR